jgi:DNA repair exonuclease SbcCD ATPase subunit
MAETETQPEMGGEQPEAQPVPEMDAAALKAELDKVQRALREANKEAASRRKRLDELEAAERERTEAQMSELERLQKQYQEANDKAARLEREKLQRDTAERIGLPLAFAARLQGETPEELEADAKTLLEALPKPDKQRPPGLNPTNPGAGSAQGETREQRRARLGL